MGEPTKAELLHAVCRLQSVVQSMHSAYANDIAQGRAEKMDSLFREGNKIAQQIIDRTPTQKSKRRFRRTTPMTNLADKIDALAEKAKLYDVSANPEHPEVLTGPYAAIDFTQGGNADENFARAALVVELVNARETLTRALKDTTP